MDQTQEKHLNAYPLGLERLGDLVPFYDNYIEAFATNAGVPKLIIVHSPEAKKELAGKFSSKGVQVELLELKEVRDIWIKDWAPLSVSLDNYVKFKYALSYLKDNIESSILNDSAGVKLARYLKGNVK
ncbi:MAG: hypothetical protein HRT72_14155 [Flavobacteriales bacterium]|nr:hypothetical protein [Flavobacteriales bacterium]